MRLLVAFFTLIQTVLIADMNMSWSSPATLFSSGDEDGALPQLVVNPSSQSASTIWIGTGTGTTVYGASFSSGSWSTAAALSSSPLTQGSPRLCIDSSGVQTAVWDAVNGDQLWVVASQNSGSSWSPPAALFSVDVPDSSLFLSVSSVAPDQEVITWQDSDTRLHGVTYASGVLGSPYLVSQQGLIVTSSLLNSTTALFLASNQLLYTDAINPTSPPANPVNKNLFTRTVFPSFSFAIDSGAGKAYYMFQDLKSKFLISGLVTGSTTDYTTITIPNMTVVADQIVISPIDQFPVAIWQLSNGQIQVANFDGHRWVNQTTLSAKGSSPSIAVHPLTNHYIAVWSDTTAQAVCIAEFDRTTWSTPQTLSATGTTISDPQITINTQGSGFVVWSRKATEDSKGLIEAVNSL